MSEDNQDSKSISDSTHIGNIVHLNDYASLIIRQLAPLTEFSEKISRSLYPIMNMQDEMLKKLQPIVGAQLKTQSIAKELAKVAEAMIKPLESYRLNFENIVSPIFVEFAKKLADLPERTKRSLVVLAKHGWYFDPDMPFRGLQELEVALEEGNVEIVNTILMEYFSEKLSEIEEKLKAKFPTRATILGAAFDAHRRKEFVLSIPVFLIQADGICYDLINKQLYSKKDKVPVIAEYAKTITTDTFRSILLYPLTQSLPISASAKERTEDFNDLNRHQVIHGESTNYDIELNSLKAISLLNYVSYVLSQEDVDSSDEKTN